MQNNNSFSGQLNKTSLPYILVNLQNNRQTGTLDINSKYEISIFIDQGHPYFAAGGSGETLLGKILLNKNKITKYQFDRALEEIKRNKDKRIGEILVNLGMITPHDLNEYLDIQLREKILETFLYLEGDFKFNVSGEIRNDLFYSKIIASEIIHEGFNKYIFASDADLDIIDFDIVNNIQDETSNLGLGSKELRLVQLLSQNKSINEIRSTGQFKSDDILRVVLLLSLYEKIVIKNININDFLLEVFKNYSLKNPLHVSKDSNHTVRESELTDPTGEVLLLNDELEITAERDKLDLDKNDNNTLINLEPETKTEQEDFPGSAKTPEMEFVEIKLEREKNKDDKDDKEIKFIENINNDLFQDSYQGNQKAIEIEVDNAQSEHAEQPETGPYEPSTVISAEGLADLPEDENFLKNHLLNFYEHIQDEEDYYKILNINRDASVDEVKEAYFKSIKKFHPDANINFPEDIRVKAERIFTKVTRAYEILSDEYKRKTFDETKELSKFREQANSIYEAEIIYTEGEMLLRQRNFKEAEKKFARAIELNPDESAYVGINAWAKYLAAPDKERVFEEVKKELKNAIDMDTNIAENYYYLGSVYKFSDNLGNAEKYFDLAIKKDPNFIEAKRELRLLQSRKDKGISTKKSGKKIEKKFWSGLFKK